MQFQIATGKQKKGKGKKKMVVVTNLLPEEE